MKTGSKLNSHGLFAASYKLPPVNEAVVIEKVSMGLQANALKFEQLIAMLARAMKHNPINERYLQKIVLANETINRIKKQSDAEHTIEEPSSGWRPGSKGNG